MYVCMCVCMQGSPLTFEATCHAELLPALKNFNMPCKNTPWRTFWFHFFHCDNCEYPNPCVSIQSYPYRVEKSFPILSMYSSHSGTVRLGHTILLLSKSKIEC